MKDIFPLSEIEEGMSACVRSLQNTEDMRRRLLDIGLIPGTEIQCLGRSPCGDPTAFFIRGAVIAIRDEDSRSILVEA